MRIRWYSWLSIFVILVVAGEGFALLLAAQDVSAISVIVRWTARVAASGWVVFALVRFHEQRWVRRLTLAIVMTVIAALLALLCRALDASSALVAVLGAYGMGMGFYLGAAAIRALLSPGMPVLGVARTLVDEAMRMKVPLVFIVALVLLVPVLPLSMDPAEKLQYRLQSFLSWSLIAVSLLLSLMTVFLAVGTVSSEISGRQIYLTLTKPLGRAQYLLGKWLGVALLNLLLVGVAGGGIFVFTLLLAQQSATSATDRAAAQEQVLTARQTIKPIGIDPSPPDPPGFTQRLRDRLAELQRQDPDRFGEPGTSPQNVSREAQRAVFEDVRGQWYTLGPRVTRTYRFVGLGDVTGQTLQLRLKPQSGRTPDPGRAHLRIEVNGELYRHPTEAMMAGDHVKLVRGTAQVLNIPTERVNSEGELAVTLTNPPVNGEDQPSIHFNTTDGMELLYQVGGFGANLARGMAMTWVRLCFVGALGIAAGSLLGFPVASVLCLLIYITAMSSGFLIDSIGQYAGVSADAWASPLAMLDELYNSFAGGQVVAGLKVIVSLIGSAFLLLVPSFDQYDAAPLISEGRVVPLTTLGSAVLWIGVIWSGVVALIGYNFFRRRELAEVIV